MEVLWTSPASLYPLAGSQPLNTVPWEESSCDENSGQIIVMTLLSGLLQERGCCRCFTIAVFSINLLTLVPGHIKAFTEDYTHILCWSICPTKQLKCHCEIYLIVKYKIQRFWFLNQVLRGQDADSRLKWETGETRAARTGQSTKCS